jgi:nicotinamide-nucleotide amidase
LTFAQYPGKLPSPVPQEPFEPALAAGPRTSVLAVGDELLTGDVVDGNRAFLGALSRRAGLPVVGGSTVGDDVADIAAALEYELGRAVVLWVTGGLGPTSDDVTTEAVARAAGVPLEHDAIAMSAIEARFAALGRAMPEINRKQALLPKGAERLDNPLGTAPGFLLRVRDRLVVCLPGVPGEMRRMAQEEALPRLRRRFALAPTSRRIYRTVGLGESSLAERIAPFLAQLPERAPAAGRVRVHYRPSHPEVLLVLEASAPRSEASQAQLAALDPELARLLHPGFYGVGEADLAARLVRACSARGRTVAFAESCTGGAAAAGLAAVAGASACLRGGVVAYANAVKEGVLGVPRAVLEAHGAVSPEVARAMAERGRDLLGADACVAISGIAGPAGGTPDKPVGTVEVAVAYEDRTSATSLRLSGNRARVQRAAMTWAYKLLWDRLVEAGDAAPDVLDLDAT